MHTFSERIVGTMMMHQPVWSRFSKRPLWASWHSLQRWTSDSPAPTKLAAGAALQNCWISCRISWSVVLCLKSHPWSNLPPPLAPQKSKISSKIRCLLEALNRSPTSFSIGWGKCIQDTADVTTLKMAWSVVLMPRVLFTMQMKSGGKDGL
jgi:hypothetical protein